MHQLRRGVLAALLSVAILSTGPIGAAGAQTLHIGLDEDADVLDPHQARTHLGRILFTAMCDRLIDLSPNDLPAARRDRRLKVTRLWSAC